MREGQFGQFTLVELLHSALALKADPAIEENRTEV